MKKKEDASPTNINDKVLVVGIGASAGGIQALQEFFKNVPKGSGCAYVVILHLSPDHDSQLVELLKNVASITVSDVSRKTKVEPDHIYVISPNKHLVMVDGYITVSENLTTEDRRAPVDIFFRTLAESHGPSAVCVILSGTGANGSMGLKKIKENGGAVYVQNPREAEFGEMPRNSIETELVDAILPVSEIPRQIGIYKDSLGVVKISEDIRPNDQQQALREIFAQIRLSTGHDFTNYKRPTLLRRIERRINIRNMPDLPSYADFLKQNPDETVALLKDLLISVTNFFRDPKAFQTIELEVLPVILSKNNDGNRVRIWVAGCATGEEAYSIAMLCAEQIALSKEELKVQIFATDIDEAAIAVARDGLYTINDAVDVSPERLRRFFNKEGDNYRVRREIREMILFATHNFLKDPPFSRLNMISCRNALIYLNQEAQERVMETFHFALHPGGYLFLGSSESVDGSNDLYSTFKREHHIFQSRQVNSRNYPVPESIPNFSLNQYQQLQKQEDKQTHVTERITYGELHHRLLEEYAPPSVVVNEEYEIVHMSEKAGKYFELPGGEPSQNLLKIVRPEIRLELRTALYKALQRQIAVQVKDLELKVDDQLQSLSIHVRPVFNSDDVTKGFILVVFEAVAVDPPSGEVVRPSDEPMARQLEQELIQLKSQLRQSAEQYEIQAEELRASNEELQAINEELRSAAEELETSKEELQSINEELRTVNQELKVKIEETSQASNNLQNLINSSDVGTIFLDRNLQIKLFTPTIAQLFNLRTSDYGRPITDITNKIEYKGMIRDAEMVLKKLVTIDREVNTTDNRFFLVRMLPYRTKEDRIDGVVMTFFDITTRRVAEDALHESQERFRTLTNAVPQLIWAYDATGKPNYFNQRWYEFSGLSLEKSIELGWQSVVHPDDAKAAKEEWEESIATGMTFEREFRLRNPGGEYSWHLVRSVPRKDADGKLIGWFGTATDIQKLKRAEERQRDVSTRLQLALEAGHLGSYEYDFKTGKVISTPQHKANYGLEPDEELSFTKVKAIVVPDDQHLVEVEYARKISEQEVFATEYRIRLKNNSIRWIKSVGRILYDSRNEVDKLVGITIDVTELKLLTDELNKQVNERTSELQRSNEDLIQFAHVASHDLKEPVRKIKIFTGRLVNEFGPQLPEKANVYLEKIQKATTRMFAMIDGVLSYSMHGIAEESFAIVDLNRVMEQIRSDLELLITQKSAVISFAALPVVRANSILMYQLFYNLVNNSLKFARPGEPLTITVTHSTIVWGNKSFLRIEFADNGIGFENEFADKIFEAFLRLNPKDQYEGTGLGLALCKKIVERHDGFISAKGEPDKGATFIILLPT